MVCQTCSVIAVNHAEVPSHGSSSSCLRSGHLPVNALRGRGNTPLTLRRRRTDIYREGFRKYGGIGMTTAALTSADAAPSIRLLGAFSVSIDHSSVTLPSNAQRVLGFLAVSGLEQRRDTVATHLWPEASPDRAMSNLRTALWRVRRAHPAIVRAKRDSVRLEDGVAVDYDLLTTMARQIIADGSDESVIGLTPDLLEIELLPGWDEEWLLLDRERYRQLRIHALETLSGLLTAKGLFGEAIDVACAAIRVEPLHESAHAALIAAHMAEGNRTEAIRHFRNYSRLLADETGLAPSPRLEQLLTWA
jgi:DNA-binding SARP family transcriptional activator